MKLAREIVEIYHDADSAQHAEKNFIRVFQKGDTPEEMPIYTLRQGQTVLDVLIGGNLVPSKSEGRRLITQNGIRLNGKVLTDPNQLFPGTGVLQAGKRRYLRIIEH
jgi:tyrosyl-tRNA synthetase